MTSTELCECGKPIEHLHAPEDSKEWGCLVPDPAKFMAEHKRHTPRRSIRIPDPLWNAARGRADERGETVTDVITRALEKYTK